MNKRILGALLVLAGLTAGTISAKSKLTQYEFANKTQESLKFTSNKGKIVSVKPGQVYHPEMTDEDVFMPFEVCTHDKQHCLNIRPGKKPHTIICCNDETAHSSPNKFDIYITKNGSLSVKGTFFYNIFSK